LKQGTVPKLMWVTAVSRQGDLMGVITPDPERRTRPVLGPRAEGAQLGSNGERLRLVTPSPRRIDAAVALGLADLGPELRRRVGRPRGRSTVVGNDLDLLGASRTPEIVDG
jgi:hypothetical protein